MTCPSLISVQTGILNFVVIESFTNRVDNCAPTWFFALQPPTVLLDELIARGSLLALTEALLSA